MHSALLLGVAGGMILRLFHEYFPKARLFGVEIDPVMITIAKEYFDLKNDLSVHLYEEDAIKWVKKEKKKYDLIVIDLYIKQLNAPGTRDIVFLKGLKKITSEKGVILYNSHFQKDKPKEYEEIVKNCKNIFSEVEEVYSYPLNRVLRLTI